MLKYFLVKIILQTLNCIRMLSFAQQQLTPGVPFVPLQSGRFPGQSLWKDVSGLALGLTFDFCAKPMQSTPTPGKVPWSGFPLSVPAPLGFF